MTMEENIERRNDTLKEVLRLLEKYLNEAGPCDHPVNICVCDIRHTLDEFGKDCYALTGGAVGWQYYRFDVDFDDPKQRALEEASARAEDTFNMAAFAMGMLTQSNNFRIAQLRAEADARNAQVKKEITND